MFAAQVIEWQDGNGRLVGQGQCSSSPRQVGDSPRRKRVCSEWLVDVLKVLQAEISERSEKPPRDGIAHRCRNHNATRLSYALKPRGNIHCCAKQVAVLVDHVPDMHADTELQLVLLPALCQLFLQRQGAAHCFYRTPELGQDTVPSGVGDATAVLFDKPFSRLADGSESGEGSRLIRQHAAGVANDVCRHDGSQSAFRADLLVRH